MTDCDSGHLLQTTKYCTSNTGQICDVFFFLLHADVCSSFRACERYGLDRLDDFGRT